MEPFLTALSIILAGFTVLGIGFSFRHRPWGVALLVIGIACMLSLLLYKMSLTFD